MRNYVIILGAAIMMLLSTSCNKEVGAPVLNPGMERSEPTGPYFYDIRSWVRANSNETGSWVSGYLGSNGRIWPQGNFLLIISRDCSFSVCDCDTLVSSSLDYESNTSFYKEYLKFSFSIPKEIRSPYEPCYYFVEFQAPFSTPVRSEVYEMEVALGITFSPIALITDITNSSAKVSFQITGLNNTTVQACGIEWSKKRDDLLQSNYYQEYVKYTTSINIGSSQKEQQALLENAITLQANNTILSNTTYYVRAYAITTAGTSFSDIWTFTSK